MNEFEGQLPMFDMAPIRVPKARKPLPPGKAKWSYYTNLKRERCDVCWNAFAAAAGKGPLPLPATHRRRTSAGETLLCSVHAEDQRAVDGLPPLPGKEKS